MIDTRLQCQQIANGWRGRLSIAVDNVVRPQRTRRLIVDFYRHFPDVELHISAEVFNGVWDALDDGRVDVAIGATKAIPVGGRYGFRDMGTLGWHCVVACGHPLAHLAAPLSDDELRVWPSLMLEDTSRLLPKRITWILDNQRRMVVPDWAAGVDCLNEGLCVAMVPYHVAEPYLAKGRWVALSLQHPFPDAACCLSWRHASCSSAQAWLLDYLGDSATLNAEWL